MLNALRSTNAAEDAITQAINHLADALGTHACDEWRPERSSHSLAQRLVPPLDGNRGEPPLTQAR
jgi:hypothetical protein